LATPRDHAQRGSQVCLTREHTAGGALGSGAFAIVQALIARGVIGDYRAGDGGIHKDILRFGFTPLYIGFEDVWNAVEHLRQVLGDWRVAKARVQPKARGDLIWQHHLWLPDARRGAPTAGESIVAEERAQLDFSNSMSYGDYLQIDTILGAQKPLSPDARRAALHRPAPDQRAVDEADAA